MGLPWTQGTSAFLAVDLEAHRLGPGLLTKWALADISIVDYHLLPPDAEPERGLHLFRTEIGNRDWVLGNLPAAPP